MAMANMNLIGVFVTKLWPVQALACGGGDGGGDGGDGGATKTIISPKFSNFGDIITNNYQNIPRDLIHYWNFLSFGFMGIHNNEYRPYRENITLNRLQPVLLDILLLRNRRMPRSSSPVGNIGR